MPALGAHDEDDVVPEPRLDLRDGRPVVARERLLQVDDLGLEVPQDVDVAVARGEREDHGLVLDEREGLGLDGVEGGVSCRLVRAESVLVLAATVGKGLMHGAYVGFLESSAGWAWSWPMLENDEPRECGG